MNVCPVVVGISIEWSVASWLSCSCLVGSVSPKNMVVVAGSSVIQPMTVVDSNFVTGLMLEKRGGILSVGGVVVSWKSAPFLSSVFVSSTVLDAILKK